MSQSTARQNTEMWYYISPQLSPTGLGSKTTMSDFHWLSLSVDLEEKESADKKEETLSLGLVTILFTTCVPNGPAETVMLLVSS